jgi:hypothetical protein
MVEMLRVLLGVLLVASFGTMAVYVLVSVAAATSTLVATIRRDRSVDELDQVLAEILGWRGPERPAEPRRWRLARRR